MSRSIQERRIRAVLQIRLDGAQDFDVQDHIAEAEAKGEEPWTVGARRKPLTPAQIGKLIEAAKAIVTDTYPNDHPDVAMHKAKLKSLFARAVAAGEHATARGILRDIADLEVYDDDEDEEDEYRSAILVEIKKRQLELAATTPAEDEREAWEDEKEHGPLFSAARWFDCQGDDAERMRYQRTMAELVEEELVIESRTEGCKWGT